MKEGDVPSTGIWMDVFVWGPNPQLNFLGMNHFLTQIGDRVTFVLEVLMGSYHVAKIYDFETVE